MRLLLDIFVKGWETDASPDMRTRVGKFASFTGIVCNILLFASKLVIGVVFGALSVTADALNNLSDASSSIITLLGFKLSEKPADAEHPYGHARFEYISGMVVAVMILFIGYELAKSAVKKILAPTAVTFSTAMAVVLMLSIALKLWMTVFNRRLGKRIESVALQAAATDSRNDVLTTTAVLLAAVLEAVTKWRVDGYISLAVAVFIIYSGIKLIKETINPLLGMAGSAETRKAVVDIVCRDPKVLGYHDLLIHDYGPNRCFASIHVEMDRREEPMLCHEIIDDIERACLEELNVNLVIHYDPIITGDAELESLRECVKNILLKFDDRLTMHDFRVAQDRERIKLIFDVALPDCLHRQKNDVRHFVDAELSKLKTDRYYSVITFDPPEQPNK